MANITTRSLTSTTVTSSNLNKGSSLTHNELDSNFINLNTEKIDVLNPDIQGDLKIAGTSSAAVGSLVLKEASDNGVHQISIKAPTALAANVAFTLPVDDGTPNQVLITDGSGALSWSSAEAGDITAVTAGNGLSGGGSSGAISLAVDVTDANIVKDEDDMASNSATHLATQQSIKAYVDASGGLSLIDEDNFASDSATRPPSQQSTKAYIATQIATKDNSDEITEGSTNLYFTNARAQAVSINNLSEDTTPQLGGDLDVNGNDLVTTSNGNIKLTPNGTGQVRIDSNVVELHSAAGLVVNHRGQGTHNGANYGAPEGDSSGSTMLFNTGVQVEGMGRYEYPSLVLRNNSVDGYPNIWAAKARPNGYTGGGTGDYTTDAYLKEGDIIFRFFGAPYQGTDGAGNSVFSYGCGTVDIRASEDHDSGAMGGEISFRTLDTGTAASSSAETEKIRIGDQIKINPGKLNIDLRVHGDDVDDVLRVDASKDKTKLGGLLKLHTASSDPSSDLDQGDIYFNTTSSKVRVYDGSSWADVT